MRGALAYAVTAMTLSGPSVAQTTESLTLPSGMSAYLQEMLWDRPGGGLIYRFRFVAPDFAPDEQDFDQTRADLDHLCNTVALPKLSNIGPVPAQIVISLADRESEFGVIDQSVAQVFEAYSVENDACVWEVF